MRLDGVASRNKFKDEQDERCDQKDVDQPTSNVHQKTDQPENEQDRNYRVQKTTHLSNPAFYHSWYSGSARLLTLPDTDEQSLTTLTGE